MSDIAFSPEMILTYADEVEVRPISKRGRAYFEMRFSPGVVSVRLKKHAAIVMAATVEAAGLGHSVDELPEAHNDLPAMLKHQAD